MSWIIFAYLMGSCQCGVDPHPVFYTAYLYYNNAKGDDLLDPKTAGYFNIDTIKVNGLNNVNGNFNISYMQPGNIGNMPEGYSLSIILKGNSEIITLNKATVDTLYHSFSGKTLVSCKYNNITISPPIGKNSFTTNFPIVVTK